MQQSKQSCWGRSPTKQSRRCNRRGFACGGGGTRSGKSWGDTGRETLSATPSSLQLLIPSPAELEWLPIVLPARNYTYIYVVLLINLFSFLITTYKSSTCIISMELGKLETTVVSLIPLASSKWQIASKHRTVGSFFIISWQIYWSPLASTYLISFK